MFLCDDLRPAHDQPERDPTVDRYRPRSCLPVLQDALPPRRTRRRRGPEQTDPRQLEYAQASTSAQSFVAIYTLREEAFRIEAEDVMRAVEVALFLAIAAALYSLVHAPLERPLIQLSSPLLLLDWSVSDFVQLLNRLKTRIHLDVGRPIPRLCPGQ